MTASIVMIPLSFTASVYFSVRTMYDTAASLSGVYSTCISMHLALPLQTVSKGNITFWESINDPSGDFLSAMTPI